MRKKMKIIAITLAGIISLTSPIKTAASCADVINNDYTDMTECEETTEEEITVESNTEEITENVTEADIIDETLTSDSETESELITECESEMLETSAEEDSSTEIEETDGEILSEIESIDEEISTEDISIEDWNEEKVIQINVPGMDSYKLSDVEQKQLNVLKQNMDDIRGIVEGKDCVEGELVFWADTEDEALLIANGYGASLKSYKYGIAVIELPEEVSIVEALELATSQTDEVVLAAAWPNYYRTAYDNDTLNLYDDPFLDKKNNNYQWQHDVTGSRYAWNMGYTGKGIKIAVLDSGCTNHGDIDILESYSCVTDNSVEDTSGHGTHVTGTIAAKFNNNKGGAGIAPQASICNIKVLENIDGKCVGTDAQVMAGIAKAIEVKADIINMSLGGDYYNAGYEKLTQKAYNKGIAIFAAAGNDASSSWSYPAECKYVYSVGSIRQDLERSEISNYGDWVEYSAPGEDILSTYETAYARMSGTSQATAVISGTAAVILSAREDIRNKTGKAKVDALLETMNKGKISGGNEASTIVSLTKALNLTTAFDKPKAPKFSVKSGTKVFGNSLALTIEKANATDTIYFSTDGKSITYKNGVVSSNAQKYVGEIVIGNAEKVTVKAIAINPFGVAGPISTATYRFAPSINEIMINGQSVLLKGRNTKLKTTILPSYAANKKVKWSITPANQGVTVSNGTVKASKSAVEGEYIVKPELFTSR